MSWGFNRFADASLFGARLTCNAESGPTAGEDEGTVDAPSVYLVPFRGGRQVALQHAGVWRIFPLSSPAELSLSSTASNTIYDVFAFWNGSAVALEQGAAWSNSGAGTSARATALGSQDGVYVKSGDATRRYVGTFRTLGAGKTEFSSTKKLVWSYHGRRRTRALIGDVNAHSYASATPRIWNGTGAGVSGCSFVLGMGVLIEPGVHVDMSASGGGTANATVRLDGVDTNSVCRTASGALATCGTSTRPHYAEPGYHEVELFEHVAGGGAGAFDRFFGGVAFEA